MKTLSKDLRERIIKQWEKGESTKAEIGRRFDVSLGMVKKLIEQQRKLGHVEALWSNCGRPAKIGEKQKEYLREAVRAKPDATLAELAAGMDVKCTAQAVFYVLRRMDLSYKKKRSMPVSATGRMSRTSARGGKGCKGVGIPTSSSSSTKREPKRT